jgi:D-apionolactonase
VLAQPDYVERFRQVWREASALGVALEVALIVSDDAETELQSFIELLRSEATEKPEIARWLVFHSDEKSTTDPWIQLARRHLQAYTPDVKVYGGTNAYFTELNRGRPNVEVVDGVCYSINPQVHAFDNRSLVETLQAHAATVESARQFTGTLPLAISPVTLKPRFNPNATGAVPDPPPGTLPEQVDVRQMSLFGAGWTLGSIKYLAESRVEHATYYETTGWRGVMETEAGSAVPDKFRSLPGSVFPLFHVLADVADFAEGEVIPTRSSDPLRVESLMLAQGDRRRLMVANLTAEPQRVVLADQASRLNVRRLEESNAIHAMLKPEAYRADPGQEVSTTGGRYELRLSPFEVVRLDEKFPN